MDDARAELRKAADGCNGLARQFVERYVRGVRLSTDSLAASRQAARWLEQAENAIDAIQDRVRDFRNIEDEQRLLGSIKLSGPREHHTYVVDGQSWSTAHEASVATAELVCRAWAKVEDGDSDAETCANVAAAMRPIVIDDYYAAVEQEFLGVDKFRRRGTTMQALWRRAQEAARQPPEVKALEAEIRELWQKIKAVDERRDADLKAQGFTPPGNDIEAWMHLGRVVGLTNEQMGGMSLGDIEDHVRAFIERIRVEKVLTQSSVNEEWIGPQSPHEWATQFEVSDTTISRWKREKKIRVDPITSKSWRVHRDDVERCTKKKSSA